MVSGKCKDIPIYIYLPACKQRAQYVNVYTYYTMYATKRKLKLCNMRKMSCGKISLREKTHNFRRKHSVFNI